MAVIIPTVTNWSVTPQNGVEGYFTLMNTWLIESTSVIASLQTAITKANESNAENNLINQQVTTKLNTATAKAELATEKANEASISATNALNSKNSTQLLFNQTEDLIESLVIPVEATYNYKTIDSNFVSEFENFIDFKIGE